MLKTGCCMERVGKIYPLGGARDVTWEVKSGDRIGLVGVNGAGKSTQLRIIAGLEEPVAADGRQGDLARFPAEFDVDVRRTVREELFQAFGEAAEVRNQQGRGAGDGQRTSHGRMDHLHELIEELGHLQTRLKGAWLRAGCSHRQAAAHDWRTKPRLSASLATTQAAGNADRPGQDPAGARSAAAR